jgi:hypothetical protein
MAVAGDEHACCGFSGLDNEFDLTQLGCLLNVLEHEVPAGFAVGGNLVVDGLSDKFDGRKIFARLLCGSAE